MAYPCDELSAAARRPKPVVPSGEGCQECLVSGDDWVHLRLCLACGHVGCCDNSTNKHATKHYRASKHPVIRSFEPGEEWGYCYVDENFVDHMPARPSEIAPVHFEAPPR
jgi:uncharacterized UBP type Zn finger protein